MPGSMRRRMLLILIAMFVGGTSSDAAEIQLRPQAEVRGSLVLLGDLADIRGEDLGQVESLRRIELFPAPARGRIRLVLDAEIRQLLQLHGVSATAHRFSGADAVRIGHKQTIPAPPPAVEVSSRQPTQREVVVARQPIAAGAVLRTADVELRRMDGSSEAPGIAVDTESVIGLEVQRSYSAGQLVDTRSLRKPILVRRGELVVVVAKAAGVRVRTTAKALTDATLGDLLSVESPENREKFSAVVTGPREAEIYAAGTVITDAPTQISTRPGVRR